MEIFTQKHHGFEENTIVRSGERISLFSLTIPLQIIHTPHHEALLLVYTEALKSGAGTLSREAFLDAQSKIGAHIEIQSNLKGIEVQVHALDTTLAQALKLFELMLTTPTFKAEEIKRIKELLINSLILSKEDSKSRAFDGFVNTVVADTDYRFTFAIDTIIEAIQKISSQDLKKFHHKIFDYEWNCTAGGSEASVTKIGASLRRMLKNNTPTIKPTVEALSFRQRVKRNVVLLDIPHKQNIDFSIGNALPLTRTHTDYPAFVFGMSVLALYGGFSGRLMSTVREKEGLTYSIYGQAEKITKVEEGFWRIATFFSAHDALKGIMATVREIETIRDQGITENELKRFKAILNTRSILINDSLSKKVHETHSLRTNDISQEEYLEYKESLQNMTRVAVNSALKKYFDTDTLIISGAGPIQSVKKELLKLI